MPVKKLIRDLPDRSRIIARVEIREPGGALSPGFSVTGEVYEPHGTWSGAAQQRNGRDIDMGGCIHNEILNAFPQLAPLVALHLSDLDGAPMHDEANGWYWYSSFDDKGTHLYPQQRRGRSDYDIACEHLRVSEIPVGLTRAEFSEFVDSLRPQWSREAEAGRALFDSLVGDES